MQKENTPSLARKKSKVHEDDLISSFSDCTSGTYPNRNRLNSARLKKSVVASALRELWTGSTMLKRRSDVETPY